MDNNYSLFQWHLFVSAVWWMLCPRDSVWPTKVDWAPKHFSMYWYDTRCFWDCCTRVATLLSPLNNWISTLWLKKGPWCHRKPNVQVEGAYNGARQLQPCFSSETSAEGHEVSSCPGRWERRRHACLSSCQWGALYSPTELSYTSGNTGSWLKKDLTLPSNCRRSRRRGAWGWGTRIFRRSMR